MQKHTVLYSVYIITDIMYLFTNYTYSKLKYSLRQFRRLKSVIQCAMLCISEASRWWQVTWHHTRMHHWLGLCIVFAVANDHFNDFMIAAAW